MIIQRGFRINEGLQIQGNWKTIDLIVREINGPQKERTAKLERIEGENKTELSLTYNGELQEVCPGVEIGIRTKFRTRGRSVPLDCVYDSNYFIRPRKYD